MRSTASSAAPAAWSISANAKEPPSCCKASAPRRRYSSSITARAPSRCARAFNSASANDTWPHSAPVMPFDWTTAAWLPSPAALTAQSAARAWCCRLPSNLCNGAAMLSRVLRASSLGGDPTQPQIPLMLRKRSYEHLYRSGMAEERGGAGGESVGAGLEHDDEVTHIRLGELHALGQQVERRAQGTDHRSGFALGAAHPVGDGDGVVLAYYLAKIAGRGQMLVQAAVRDQKHLPARDLAVEHATHVNAGLADQIAAQLDDQPGFGQALFHQRGQRAQVGADRGDVERLFSGEIRYAEAAADIDVARRRGGLRRQTQRQLDGFLLGLADRLD